MSDRNSWYPSCVVKLTIRFDEALQIASGEPRVGPAKQFTAVTVVGAPRRAEPDTRYPLFSDEGPAFYARAFEYNRRYATAGPYVTALLSPADQAAFAAWLVAFRVPFNANAAFTDYDMRGYWLAVIKPGGVWDGQHFPDTWKTPYDTTFSAESQYAAPGCPLKWIDGADGHERLFNTATGEFVYGPPLRGKALEDAPAERPRRLEDGLGAFGELEAETGPGPIAELGTDEALVVGGEVRTELRPVAADGPLQAADTAPITMGADRFTVICNRVPKRGVFTLPHPRTAATFTMAFDYQEFPIDPRLIRAVGVEVHLGAVSPDDYARGMAGQKDSTGRPLSILKTTTEEVDPVSGRPAVNKSTLLFYGLCDTWDVDHGDSGSTVQLKGRDVRALFIDAKPPMAKLGQLDLTKPIDQVVRDIIATMGLDADLRLTVATDVGEWDGGRIPSPGDADGLTKVRSKPSGGAGGGDAAAGGGGTGGTPQTGGKTSYWDLITNYCTLVGGIPQIEGSTLWIRPVRRVFDIVAQNSTIATPFAGGQPRTVGTEQIRARRLVYGRDISKLSISRKFAGAVVPTIQCISFDDRASGRQRLIFGQWPPDDTAAAQAKGGDSDVLRVPMYGVRSVEQLTRIAHGIYEEIGRGETGGQAETKSLATLGGDNSDPDILRLRPTQPIELVVDARALRTLAPVVSELTDQARRTFSEEVDVLHRRLGDRLVARALVALARGAVRELLTFYQVMGVEYDWSSTGVRTTISFQNYIVPRQAVLQADIGRPKQVSAATVEVSGTHAKAQVKPADPPRDAFDQALDTASKLLETIERNDASATPGRPRLLDGSEAPVSALELGVPF